MIVAGIGLREPGRDAGGAERQREQPEAVVALITEIDASMPESISAARAASSSSVLGRRSVKCSASVPGTTSRPSLRAAPRL